MMAHEILPLVCSVILLGPALGIDQMWTHKVDVIRIQNNGSQIRTIFLPKLSSTSNMDIVGGSGLNSSNLVFDSNWFTDKPKNHSASYIDNEVRTVAKQNVLGKRGKNFYTKFTKPFKKMQDGNFSTYSILHSQKQHSSGNRSFTPAIQFNVGANKIAKYGLVGTCYHAVECDAIEGRPLGPCAQGYGVCCYDVAGLVQQLLVTPGTWVSRVCRRGVGLLAPGTYNVVDRQHCTLSSVSQPNSLPSAGLSAVLHESLLTSASVESLLAGLVLEIVLCPREVVPEEPIESCMNMKLEAGTITVLGDTGRTVSVYEHLPQVGVNFINSLLGSIKMLKVFKALLKCFLASHTFYTADEFLAFKWETTELETAGLLECEPFG
ncbi:hypothetical protein J6590_075427 [Homalodisca vitripennis]|nr:hypothetical protein J6590_075427 [Homalodisca vitripennis]